MDSPSPDQKPIPLILRTPMAQALDAAALARGWTKVPHEERLQAARQLRERPFCVPFYAKKAKQELEATGSEMGYWLELQGSRMISHRRTTDSTAPTEGS